MTTRCSICGITPHTYIYFGREALCTLCNEKLFIEKYKKIQADHAIYSDPKEIEKNIKIYEKYKNES